MSESIFLYVSGLCVVFLSIYLGGSLFEMFMMGGGAGALFYYAHGSWQTAAKKGSRSGVAR